MPIRVAATPDYECSDPTCDALPFTTPEAAARCPHTRPGDPIRKGSPVGHHHLGDAAPVRPTVAEIRAAAPPSVATPTSSGQFEVVSNGFGGTTTRRVAAARPGNAPTERQTSYLRSLLAERDGIAEAEIVRARLNLARVNGNLTKSLVSTAIDDLLKIKVARVAGDRPARKVEGEGRVTIDKAALPTPARGVLRFAVLNGQGVHTFLAIKYRDGGEIVVCQEIGGRGDEYLGRQLEGQCYRGKHAGLLAKVLADPMEAMLTYGREIGRCGHCGTTLTNKDSRDAGIGPVCAKKG